MSENITNVNDANFNAVVLESNQPVLVDFWAAWCGPCRALAPIVAGLAERYAGKARIVKLDVDDNPSVVGRYHVQAIPTLILFQEGHETARLVGVSGPEAIGRAIDAHVGSVEWKETEDL